MSQWFIITPADAALLRCVHPNAMEYEDIVNGHLEQAKVFMEQGKEVDAIKEKLKGVGWTMVALPVVFFDSLLEGYYYKKNQCGDIKPVDPKAIVDK